MRPKVFAYFGTDYYMRSSTMLPVLTDEKGGFTDWGKVEMCVERGDTVTIRPATPDEHTAMAALLGRLLLGS